MGIVPHIKVHGLTPVQESGDVLEGLAHEPAALREVAGAAGAAIVCDDRVARVGACPPESVVIDLARWIGERPLADGTFATDALSADDARWAPWAGDVSGVIAMALPSAAKGIVEAHGGTLRARSRPGAGTTFAFTLPVDRSDPSS